MRVYDVLLWDASVPNLADLLEIRLHELAPVVHEFVIVEYSTWPTDGSFQALLEGPHAHRYEARYLGLGL